MDGGRWQAEKLDTARPNCGSWEAQVKWESGRVRERRQLTSDAHGGICDEAGAAISTRAGLNGHAAAAQRRTELPATHDHGGRHPCTRPRIFPAPPSAGTLASLSRVPQLPRKSSAPH